jgi:hypothetical protein
LHSLATSLSGRDLERAILAIAPYLAPEVLADIIAGREPAHPARCAAGLERYLSNGKWPRELQPVIAKIEKAAVAHAGQRVINCRGGIHHTSRFAPQLVPELANLSIRALIRLKLERWFKANMKKP